jgi:hypothetical protein
MELRQVQVRIDKAKTYIMNGERKIVDAIYALGAFHCWEHYKDENSSCVWGIVELEDGKLRQFEIDDIKFTHKPLGANLFEDGLNSE